MKQKIKIGIDVGGTNTDLAILTTDNTILYATKINAQNGVLSSIAEALTAAHNFLKPVSHELRGIFLGSTYATNALLQPERLERVGVIRIGSTMKDAVPPGYQFPPALKQVIIDTATIDGGHKIDGALLNPLNEAQATNALTQLLDAGMQSCAIIGTFAALYPEHEKAVARAIQTHAPHIPVTCSFHLGGTNFIERENSAICNAALIQTLTREFEDITTIMKSLGLTCPLFMIQNNGTTISMDEACRFPIKTIAAGPANSIMGAMLLSQIDTAIIIDIGGTSADIGFISDGYPQQSFAGSSIADVSLNIPMADTISIALGGGSIVTVTADGHPIIGPQSVGKELPTKALSFGGSTLTLFDCAVAAGLVPELKSTTLTITSDTANQVLTHAAQRIARELKTARIRRPNASIILVGGSTFLAPYLQALVPDTHIIVPSHAEVANAFGAACARISGTIDTTTSLLNRESVLKSLEQDAMTKAVAAGARHETTSIINRQIIPYGYSHDNRARVIITAAGYL
ncbi:TPA: hypothetical protein DCW54_01750 [Candidatus Dependentiae bacterium]|nr:hypothetical protein [Candidatus Dependentiae bacterium]